RYTGSVEELKRGREKQTSNAQRSTSNTQWKELRRRSMGTESAEHRTQNETSQARRVKSVEALKRREGQNEHEQEQKINGQGARWPHRQDACATVSHESCFARGDFWRNLAVCAFRLRIIWM